MSGSGKWDIKVLKLKFVEHNCIMLLIGRAGQENKVERFLNK